MATPSEFITIQSTQTVGAIGALPRTIVVASRESVAGGYVPDPITGLYQINASDAQNFINANLTTSPGLTNAVRVAFGGSIQPLFIYILSQPTGISNAALSQANINPRNWSFITLASKNLGNGDAVTYLQDAQIIANFVNSDIRVGKLFCFTFNIPAGAVVSSMPVALQIGGALNAIGRTKTIISNSLYEDNPYLYDFVSNNICLAWLAFCLYGGYVVRSMGSLSDAHDFPNISADTYSQTERSFIASQNLGQYNGSKDYGNTPFVFDTQLNDSNNPPQSPQIETQIAIDFINDYVKVGVHNAFQAAGQSGLTADQNGINVLRALVQKLTKDCYDLGAILSTPSGQPAFTVTALTAQQVTQLSPTWQATGVWPAGVIRISIQPFAATHYIVLSFTYE